MSLIDRLTDEAAAARKQIADRFWTEAERDAYEERAAILEFDAGMSRDEAEAEAKRIVLSVADRAGARYGTNEQEPVRMRAMAK